MELNPQAREMADEPMVRHMLSSSRHMNTDDAWVVLYTGNVLDVDFLKCVLAGSGIESMLENETIGMMAPHHSPGCLGSVRLVIAKEDLLEGRTIVEDYIHQKRRTPLRIVERE